MVLLYKKLFFKYILYKCFFLEVPMGKRSANLVHAAVLVMNVKLDLGYDL